jgi:transposase
VGKTKRAKGTKLVALAERSGFPIAVCAASPSPPVVTLVDEILAASVVRERPERLIGDRAYDSDQLDAALQEKGIELMAPHRTNRRKPKTQNGRKLRRYKRRWYKRRWKIERLFAWLGNFRRLVVR